MNTSIELVAKAIIDALGLPPNAKLEQRVPKKMLQEQGAPTAADKRLIQDGIDELIWVAALKPTTIGVPAFKDSEREYLEIAVLSLTLRPAAKASSAARLFELIHRAIPYPVFLLASQQDTAATSLSFAHKRFSQNEADKYVVDEVHSTALQLGDATVWNDFLASLSLNALPRQNLLTLYQGWIDQLSAWEASCVTGVFSPPESDAHARTLRQSLHAMQALSKELASLRADAGKAKQMNRRVDINLRIRSLESELAAHQSNLAGTAKVGAGRTAPKSAHTEN